MLIMRIELRLIALTLLLTIIFHENESTTSCPACSEFLATEPHSLDANFIYTYEDYLGYDAVKLEMRDEDHHLHHEIWLQTLDTVVEDNDTISLCVSFHSVRSQIVEKSDTGSGNTIASVFMDMDWTVPTGIVNVSAECWALEDRIMHKCEPVFIPMPAVMKNAVFSHSPLNERFWNLRNDSNFAEGWIEALYIDYTQRNIPSSWISGVQLSGLRSLKITGNDWGRPKKLLPYLPDLVRLDLSNNNIQELPKDYFNNTPALENINLARNNLSLFPSGLEQLTKLYSLEITSEQGQAKLYITDGDLLTISKLYYLTLSGCSIDKINDVSFDLKWDNLFSLDLSNNNLIELPPKLFSTLTDIRDLYLQENNLERCPEFIEFLPQIHTLNLSHNNISLLTKLCANNKGLGLIDLSYNQITYIMDGVFESSTDLMELQLSNNKLSRISPSVFDGLSTVRSLDLSNNQITSEVHFRKIEIVNLNLSNNRLVTLTNLLNYDAKIDTLDVSRNNITGWDKISPYIKKLNLSYNGITKFSEEMLESFKWDIELIDLGENPFNCCDKNLKDVDKWLKNTHIDIRNLDTKHVIRCSIPGENQRYPIRDFADEEGLCHEQGSSSSRYDKNDESVLYGVIGILCVLSMALSFTLAIIVYKLRDNVFIWLKLED